LFLSITLKFILPLVSWGSGALKGIFGTGVRKHPNAYIAFEWNLNLIVIIFLTTLTQLARVVSRNNASPSDGDNERLVSVRGGQCHDNIKDIRKKSRLMPLQGPLLHSPKWRVTPISGHHLFPNPTMKK